MSFASTPRLSFENTSLTVFDANLDAIIDELCQMIESNDYRGYDPYDGLMSPIFRLPVLRSHKKLRWAAQQFLKRIPLNIRPVLGIAQGRNPVTLGLMLRGYTTLMVAESSSARRFELEERAEFCVSELMRGVAKGYSGACWGYDFDWESRYASMPAGTPTVVATGFITDALMKYWRLTKSDDALSLCKSACDFVLNDLHRVPYGELFCFSYSPVDGQEVLNATMKGARLLAQVALATNDKRLIDLAYPTVLFTVAQQEESGRWRYSLNDSREWSDAFHTGYVLDALDEFLSCAEELHYEVHNDCYQSLQNGFKYFTENFFTDDLTPKYYDRELFPMDATSFAQCIRTLVRFGELTKAERVANQALKHLHLSTGGFIYRKKKWYSNCIPFTRWSNAWMFLALAELKESLTLTVTDDEGLDRHR